MLHQTKEKTEKKSRITDIGESPISNIPTSTFLCLFTPQATARLHDAPYTFTFSPKAPRSSSAYLLPLELLLELPDPLEEVAPLELLDPLPEVELLVPLEPLVLLLPVLVVPVLVVPV